MKPKKIPMTAKQKTLQLQKALLQAYLKHGTIYHACLDAEIARVTQYDWLERDKGYAKAFKDAQACYLEILEREADRRAREGWDEAVFYKGDICGYVRKFSDTMLIVRLKRLDPSYRDRYDVNHSGSITYEEVRTNVSFDK